SFFQILTDPSGVIGGTRETIFWKFDSRNWAFDFLPKGFQSVIEYTVQVNDGHGGSDRHVVQIKITGTNDAPVVSAVTLTEIAEDSGPRIITQEELLAHASDVDGSSLTAVNLQVDSGNGTLIDNSDGTWTYIPALNDDTSVTFSYEVSD